VKNPEYYWTKGPDTPIDLSSTPWVADVSRDVELVGKDPQLRLLVGPRVFALMERARNAPRRTGPFSTKIAASAVEPVPYEGASPGWFRDAKTGDEIVQEDDGSWHRITRPPPGAFTVGELVLLDAELEAALGRLADAADANMLSRAQRKLAGERLGEAAEDVAMRVMLQRLQLTAEEEQTMKRSALEMIADLDENPAPAAQRRLKQKLLR
jgi:hypothetical protein